MSIFEKLSSIQQEIKVPKNLRNTFGNYNYRNAESILEAFKPFERKYKVALVVMDEIVPIADRVYIKAIATIYDTEDAGTSISATAFAREPSSKKGMDDSQITGSTSSYARKYALNGLFLLDDTKDADSNENHLEEENQGKKKEDSESGISNEKIGEFKARALIQRCNDDGVSTDKIMSHFKVNYLADLTEKQYSILNQYWGRIKGVV